MTSETEGLAPGRDERTNAAAEAAKPRRIGKGTSVKPPGETTLFKMCQVFCRVFTTLYFDLKVSGTENLPRQGGVLLVSNHQSYLDPILLGVRLPRALSYMAKSELFDVHPAFTWGIRQLGAFPVRQTGSAAGAIKESVERLQAGHALNIFPEGSRTHTGEILPMEKGVALVIRRARVPVVPVAIHGSYEAMPMDTNEFNAHPIRMRYGPPMDLADEKPDVIISRIDRVLREMFESLREGERQRVERERR